MRSIYSNSESELDARNIKIELSEPVRRAFRSLAVAVRRSEHFDQDMYDVMQDLSKEAPLTLHAFITCLPLIAEQMQEHVSSGQDVAVKDAWRDLCTQIPEAGGFKLTQPKARGR